MTYRALNQTLSEEISRYIMEYIIEDRWIWRIYHIGRISDRVYYIDIKPKKYPNSSILSMSELEDAMRSFSMIDLYCQSMSVVKKIPFYGECNIGNFIYHEYFKYFYYNIYLNSDFNLCQMTSTLKRFDKVRNYNPPSSPPSPPQKKESFKTWISKKIKAFNIIKPF